MAETGQVHDHQGRRRFEIDLGDGRFAFADYNLIKGKILFTHTEVPPDREGEGLGTRLIEAAVASARERGLKVIPICPFFAAWFERHPEEADLLDSGWAERLGLADKD